MVHKITWKALLSDGNIYYENKGIFEESLEKPSSWQQMEKYIIDNGLSIVAISLITDTGFEINTPKMTGEPDLKSYKKGDAPIDFLVKRSLARDLNITGSLKDLRTKIENVGFYTILVTYYKGYTIELWVDENDTKKCWLFTK